jgi:two-component system OmpR family response regulator
MPDTPPPARVLVVDGEQTMAELVALALRAHGFTADVACSGRAALHSVVDRRPDVLVLEAELADLDGFQVARRVRELEGAGSHVPIIFLSARAEPGDRAAGLRLGGDDYMAKPFSPEELVERVRAILRRCEGRDRPAGDRLLHADLVMDTGTREVWRNQRPVELSPTEYRLLHYLLSNARQVLTRDQILVHVWGYEFGGNASVLETYISYLRHKLDRAGPPLIHTIRGVGYTLREQPPATDQDVTSPA